MLHDVVALGVRPGENRPDDGGPTSVEPQEDGPVVTAPHRLAPAQDGTPKKLEAHTGIRLGRDAVILGHLAEIGLPGRPLPLFPVVRNERSRHQEQNHDSLRGYDHGMIS
jgi:hypothetical protein